MARTTQTIVNAIAATILLTSLAIAGTISAQHHMPMLDDYGRIVGMWDGTTSNNGANK